MQILIAEDNPTLARMLQAQLEKMGYEAACVSNGETALDLLMDDPLYQLAIIDWVMPGMDGLTLCRTLRQKQPEQPVYLILLTANNQQEMIIQGLEAGADDYITKPYHLGELQARIQVGCRMISMMNAVQEQQRLQGALVMARTVCHEMNQPLQVALSYAELAGRQVAIDSPLGGQVAMIQQALVKIGGLTRKIMRLPKCVYKEYLGGRQVILDLDYQEKVEEQGDRQS